MKRRARFSFLATATLVVAASACSLGRSVVPAPQPAATATPRPLSNDIRWFRTSAEFRALASQAYQIAADRLPELTRGLAAQTWAVILDADETTLDNSEYQRRRFVIDSAYTPESWASWVNERAAPAIPGASEFTLRVRELGGRVVIVTNRAEGLCAATRANLERVRVVADAVLCQPANEADKTPRFQRVQTGAVFPGGAPITVVAWVGDNILDFPGMTQASRDDPRALAEFGKRYFILPNPMYGSWLTR